jgi:hypothetical protein
MNTTTCDIRRANRGISAEVDPRDYPDPCELLEREIAARKKAKAAGILKESTPWMPEDVEFLRKNYNSMTTLQIAEKLGRDPKSVENKIYRLGLRKHANQ